MLRTLVVLLLVANLAFFGWTQGWLDTVVGIPARGDREPERLARQVRPELIRILPPSAASEPANEVPACLEAGPFDDVDLPAAVAALQAAAAGVAWTDVKTQQPGEWIVYMGRFADRESLVKKQDELRRRGIAFELVTGPRALEPGLSLGRFDDKTLADKALAQFTQQGLRTARVTVLAAPAIRHSLRVEKADGALAARLATMRGGGLGRGFAACETPPRP